MTSRRPTDRLKAARSTVVEVKTTVEATLPPRVLQSLPIIAGVSLGLLGLVLPAHPLQVLTHIVILGIFGIAYDLLFGYTGLLSFGHAAFFGTGAYVAIYFTVELQWPLLAIVLVAVLVGIVLSVGIGIISLRTHGVYFAMLTLAIAQLLYIVAYRLDVTGGASGLPVFARPETMIPVLDLGNNVHFYLLCVTVLVLTYLVVKRVLSSPMGDVFRAIRENEERARMIGYRTFHYKLISLTISGVFSVMAGVLFGLFLYFASPQFLYWTMSGEVLLLTLFGGAGTLLGPFFGAVFIVLVEEFLSPITDHWLLLVGIAFVLVVILFPKGIVGTITREE